MNVQLLITSIVRQTTVLIAQLATTAGARAPLAHIANQVFLDLVGELEQQGVGRKVIADMFGLALRSYQQKVARLSESATDTGITLWEAVYDWLQEHEVAGRADILRRFRHDDEASVRGILNDLVESGLVYRTGRGPATVYRIASPEDVGRTWAGNPDRGAESLVWLTVYREGPIDLASVAEISGLDESQVREAVETLMADGRVTESEGGSLRADTYLLSIGEDAGFEAALVDHYQAMVTSMVAKLRNGATRALPDDRVGGSTFTFDVWSTHPSEEEVYGLLSRHRAELISLWERVNEYNREARGPRADAARVTFYLGQSVLPEGGADLEGDDE